MSTATWRRAISQAPREFLLSKLKVIEGTIPKSLNGSLYRNGPGRLERGGQPMGHWFDGDGSILGVHFKDGEARGTQRYVQTDGYKEEEAANKLLFANFGLANGGPFWNKLTGRKGKNPANTSVLPLPNRLLALWEGGWPHALDLETLETIGIDSLGMLDKGQSFSAHPKVDPVTGDIYNIGFKNGRTPNLCFYKLDKNGKKIAETQIANRMNMVHDFTLAGRYIVVMNFATEMQGLLGFLLGYKSYNDILQWNPSLGTEVIVLDRNDLSLVTKFKTDPFYAFHFTNGYEDKDGSIYVEFCKYNSFPEINEFLTGVPNMNSSLSSFLGGRLTSMKIDPKKGRMIEMKELAEGFAEFPTVADSNVGERWRYSLFASEAGNKTNSGSIPDAISRYDYNTQTVKSFGYGKNQYVSEPLLVSSEQDPEKGNILAVVYDSNEHKSELWIHDSENLEKDPLCRIALPEVIPPGFHGRWKNN